MRSWRLTDAPALALAANNRNVWLTLRDLMPHPYSLDDAEEYLHQAVNAESEQSFCIEVGGVAAGVIGLKPKDDVHRHTAELGYWLAESFWGRGIMSEAVNAFVGERFRALALHRIFAEVFSNNLASVRVLEKAGFQFEGRLRHNVVKDEVVLDSLVYARVREV